MNKTLLIGIIAILVVAAIGGFLFFQNSSQSQKQMTEESDNLSESTSSDSLNQNSMTDESKTDEQAMTTSRYVPYSKSALEAASQSKRVLYFFANWCPTCKPADENFQANSSLIPENVTVIRVNYNDTDTDQEEKDLAKKYGVTYQHTYVQIDENGNEVTKWNGGQLDELLEKIK